MSAPFSTAAVEALLYVQKYIRGNYDRPMDGHAANVLSRHFSEFGYTSVGAFLDALRDSAFTTILNGLIYRNTLPEVCPEPEPCPDPPEPCPEIHGGLITFTHLPEAFLLNFGGAGGVVGATVLDFPNAVDAATRFEVSFLNDIETVRMPEYVTTGTGFFLIDELPLCTLVEIPKILVNGALANPISIANSPVETIDVSSMVWVGTGGELLFENLALTEASVNAILVRTATFIGVAFAGTVALNGGTSAAPTGAGAAAAASLTTAGWTIVTN